MTKRNPYAETEAQVTERLHQLLSEQSSVIHEARMLPDGPLSDEHRRYARDLFRGYIERKVISRNSAAKQMNLAPSTISEYLSETYRGDIDAVARKVVAWVELHASAQEAGMAQGFTTTRITTTMLAVLKEAHRTQRIVKITGPSGVSKTVVCKAAERELIPGSVHIECSISTRSPTAFLTLWAKRLGLPYDGTMFAIQDRIIAYLSGTKRLQMIDEAHYLTTMTPGRALPLPALHAVRDVCKQAEVGIALVGTRDINTAVDDSSMFYGQMRRLVAFSYDIIEEHLHTGDPLYDTDEIIRFAKTMGLRLTTDGAAYLRELASIPGWGGLGQAELVLRRAALLAKGASISDHHLRDADNSAQGRTYADQITNRIDDSKRKLRFA